MNVKPLKLVALDYDGTLAQSNSKIASNEHNALIKLGNLGICRVVATGRSLFSVDEVLSPDTPIDYLVFSSGVGVMEWKSRDLLFRSEMNVHDVELLLKDLMQLKLDFMLHHSVPNNHCFYYHQENEHCPDFSRRLTHYADFASPLNRRTPLTGTSQLVIVLETDGEKYFNLLKEQYPNLNIVRTTSPLDNKSMWIEIFPKEISKASGIDFILNKTGINRNETLCIGNDFNDLDMLRFTEKSFVVDNAPQALKDEFPSIASNDNGGVGKLLNKIFS